MSLIKETNLPQGALTKRSSTSRIVVHHSAATADTPASTIRDWHLREGYSTIGYHFVIREDGTIERGREENSVGAHAYGFNSNSIGICIVGNFEEQQSKDKQIEACSMLLADLCTRYNLTPNAYNIVAHRDLMSTACCGKNLYSLMGTLRGKAIWYQQNPCW